MGNLIRAANMWGLSDLVRELGADPEDLQVRSGIRPGAEHDDDAFVTTEAFVRMLETAAVELDCPDFGLRLSHWQGLVMLGPIAVVARNAQTVADGLEAIGRYLYVHSPSLRLSVERVHGTGDLRFRYEVVELTLPELRQSYELSMANGAHIMRFLGGPEARPDFISFLHEQVGPDDAYERTLGCPVRFGQTWCGFEVPRGLAGRPIDAADPQTRRIATKYLETEFPPSSATLAERVADLARRLLPTGQCSADTIADELGMHPRTLQRHLAQEGVRCQDVIDATRRGQAATYLGEPMLQLGQIAGLLGYAEQSTLSRSCRRWFGQTPREYRAGLG